MMPRPSRSARAARRPVPGGGDPRPAVAAGALRHIEINIGKLCNNACVFCGNGTVPEAERPWVPADRVLGEIGRAAREGYRSLGFLGGEVTVYPHALEAIRTAKDAGFVRIALCTNGRRLESRELLDRMIDAGVTRVALSIHSHEAGIEDRLCKRPRAFSQKIAAIENLVGAAAAGRLPDGFSLNSCVHGANFKALKGMAAFFKGLGVDDIRFNAIRPEHEALMDRSLIPRYDGVVPEILRLILENERRLGMTITFGDFPLCVWPDSFLSNLPLARRYIGELRDFDTHVTVFRTRTGDGAPDRFRWKDRRTDVLKTRPPACGRCAARGACEGVWTRYTDIYGTGEIRAIRSR
jgi:MoaA/NifB/PqqE/SkfB family radical SAM enzyme